MKIAFRILALLFALVLSTVSFVYAETIDLSGMTYAELVALKNQINLAIWNSQEWQEVTVPQGVWVVGEDIPAGHWTVKCINGPVSNIQWGTKLDESGEEIEYHGRYSTLHWIYNPSHYTEEDGLPFDYSFEVYDGEYIVIGRGPMVFMPYTGKPDLGFK